MHKNLDRMCFPQGQRAAAHSNASVCFVIVALLLSANTIHGFSSSTTYNQKRASVKLGMAFELTIADQYNDMVANYPLVTASLTSGSLAGVGDAIAQLRGDKTTTGKDKPQEETSINVLSKFDTDRNRRFIIKGLGGGLIWLFWFQVADGITQQLMPLFVHGTAATSAASEISSGDLAETTIWLIAGTTLLSILLDQFLASPIIFSLWDIPLPLILSGAHREEKLDIPQHVESKLGGLLLENAKVWSIANAVIYNLPLEYRVLGSSLTDLVWQSIVSNHVNANTEEKQ